METNIDINPLDTNIVDSNIVDSIFDKIFIINLDERQDRWEKCLEQLVSHNIKNYERFSAIKPSGKLEYKTYNKILNKNLKYNKKYITGVVGCKLSHYTIIKIAKERNYKQIMILEDDFQFSSNFNQTISDNTNNICNLDWKMLYFGGNYLRIFSQPITSTIYRSTSVNTTHAYAIKNVLFDTIINNSLNSGMEIDCYYRLYIHQKHKTICFKPSIITQRASFSDILQRNVSYGV